LADADHNGCVGFAEFDARMLHDEANLFHRRKKQEERAAHAREVEASRASGQAEGRAERRRLETRIREEATDEAKQLRARLKRVTEQLSLVTSELSARKDATAEEYLSQRRAVAHVAARMLSQEVDSRARPATAARSRQVGKLARAIEANAFPMDPIGHPEVIRCSTCGTPLQAAALTA